MPSSTRLTTLALLIYVPLGVAALAWASLGQARSAWSLAAPALERGYPERLAISLALGAVLAWGVVAITPILVERTAWARGLHRELRPLVESLTTRSIVLLALSSGIAEELFFRGAMQPVIGIWWTSLIFAALHSGPKWALVAWSAWAFVMGLLFGWIFEYTGVLAGPILAHVWINQRNLTYMRRH